MKTDTLKIYQFKVERVLQTLLEPNCRVSDYNLNKLLTFLSGNDSIHVPILSKWIFRAIYHWSANGIYPSFRIATFTLNLANNLLRHEDIFCSLNNNGFLTKLIKTLQVQDVENPSTIKLVYIKLLSSFLEHKTGVKWMLKNNFWEDILELSLIHDNFCVTKESQDFMSKLLEKVINYDESFCDIVVKKILAPLGGNTIRAIHSATCVEVTDLMIQRSLCPTLQLLGSILEYFLEDSIFSRKDFRIVLIFLENFNLEQRISDFMMIAQNQYLHFDMVKIMFIMQFLELYVNVVTSKLTMSEIQNAIERMACIYRVNLLKGDFDEVMKFCDFGIFYWSLVKHMFPCPSINKALNFTNGLLVILLLPLICLNLKQVIEFSNLYVFEFDDFRYVFVQRLFKFMLYENTIRIAYIWRHRLISHPRLYEFSIKCVMYTMKSRKFYTREQAALVFQTYIYTLKDLVDFCEDSFSNLETVKSEEHFVLVFLEALSVFIDEVRISWKDSVETICVCGVTYDFLKISGWSTRIIVQALKLLNISLEKYMCPNLTLLVDSTRGSSLVQLGPLLFSKLLDSDWEVKNTALEIVYTVVQMAKTKFPSLQKVLMDSDLPNLVVQMSTSDGESFVRATAIKCLQEMIQVEDIWNNVLKSQDLPQKMRHILLNETEGIVRVEAATFMCKAYEHQHFPEEIIDRVYDTMIHSSTADLHWEVKVRALGFWDQVITSYLQNQGMIDGSFPSVTFSKEHRKIVTLTDSEIKKRLQKVIHQLSNIGCLGVLISAIKDDCDMEVSKTAVNITQKLVELLKKYNIRADSSILTSPLPTEYGASSSASVSSGISADESMGSPVGPHPDFNDEIIDQIVNSKDINLLKNVYASSDYGSVLNYDIQVRKIVNPNEFLQFIQQDLNLVITEKKNWLNGIEDLGSLLDDMLKTYDDDINNMDCY